MARFRFKFEAVADVRKRAEDQALRVFAQAQQGVQAAVHHKERLLGELNDTLLRREALGSRPTSGLSFQLETEFITGIKQRIVQADQAIVRANRALQKAMAGYLFARREKKIIETLREKQLHNFKAEQKKREQKELDDLYLMRARMSQLLSIQDGEESQ